MSQTDIRIRQAVLEDLHAIRSIYNHYVARSTCTFQVQEDTENERREWFQSRSRMHPVLVAETAEFLVGWAALSPWKSRCAYEHSAEVSVYIHHEYHRKGIGKGLLTALVALGRDLGHHTLIGGACTEQAASLALQQSLGFVEVARFREVGRKFDRWLDVAYLQLML